MNSNDIELQEKNIKKVDQQEANDVGGDGNDLNEASERTI